MMPLYGLVLAGGESRRMKRDKSLLSLQGKTLTELAHGKLEALCQKTFVSVSPQQMAAGLHANFQRIPDTRLSTPGIGAMGGILAAQEAYPDAAWLVLACDMPFVNTRLLDGLIMARNTSAKATLYRLQVPAQNFQHDKGSAPITDKKRGLQPLCCIYEPAIHLLLSHAACRGNYSLRAVLEDAIPSVIDTSDELAFSNLNNPVDLAQARTRFRSHRRQR